MAEFRVTFPQRLRREEHPRQAGLNFEPHPDGWLAIDADTEPQARSAVFALLGQVWAFIYAEPFGPDWDRLYPKGELAHVTAHTERSVI